MGDFPVATLFVPTVVPLGTERRKVAKIHVPSWKKKLRVMSHHSVAPQKLHGFIRVILGTSGHLWNLAHKASITIIVC